jgi:predicted transcriptional regulator
MKSIKLPNPVKHREVKKENQSVFWGRLGCTQSCGSRYESGRRVPKSVRMLLALSTGKATVDQLRSGELAALV